MAKTSLTEVKKLILDLENFRTTPQKNEIDAIKAMVIVKPDKFYGLIDSLIEDGYLPTDNIIVLNKGGKLIVKEGNRRIAILKLIHGLHDIDDFNLPTNISDKVKKVDSVWKKENSKVPCSIYDITEENLVDKIVNLSHGKGEKASRDHWTSVARARHNKISNNASELSLDLLEKYILNGQNLSNQQKEKWAGDYPLTVLDEGIKKLIPRLGVVSLTELIAKYPKISLRTELENILRDIGLKLIDFPKIRDRSADFASPYGIPLPTQPPTAGAGGAGMGGTGTETGGAGTSGTGTGTGGTGTGGTGTGGTGTGAGGTGTGSNNPAYATNDPRHVLTLLKNFTPQGNNRQKVVALRDEMKKLKITDTPIAFCFLIRSIFEISAKAYCFDHSISLTKTGGKDKSLVEILRDITNHLTNHNSNMAKVKQLHGAMAEMGRSDGLLSVTSMNQLVHNPSFSIIPGDVCTLFSNIYQLLEEMN